MMCFACRFTLIGDNIRKIIRNLPFMSFVIYWLGVNKFCLIKGGLVVKRKPTCSRKRVRISTWIDETPRFLDPNRNVSTRKLNGRWECHQTLGSIRRRRLVGSIGRNDMLRRLVGRSASTWNKKLSVIEKSMNHWLQLQC